MTNNLIGENQMKYLEDDYILKRKALLEFKKALYMIDMNNGFVNFGAMANPEYNKLVPEQLRLINMFRSENELVNFVLEGHSNDAAEFRSYPVHCKLGSLEAELIPQFAREKDKVNTRVYYKNSINGMLNKNLRRDIERLKNLKEIVVGGVCADLCVMDFSRTCARLLDELNREVVMFVVKSAIDTFDAPGHNREEWLNIAYKVMEQAGIILVDNTDELVKQEYKLGLRKKL